MRKHLWPIGLAIFLIPILLAFYVTFWLGEDLLGLVLVLTGCIGVVCYVEATT